MSRHYLLDGYNIIKQTPAWADLNLQDGRSALIRWVNAHKPHGSANNQVTIVFDGNINYYGTQDGGCALVVFSSGTSADEVIKDMVESSPHPKDYIVVSDDKDIFIYARDLGAKVLKVKEFMGNSKPKGSYKSGSSSDTSKHISLSHQQMINKELSKLWLNNEHP